MAHRAISDLPNTEIFADKGAMDQQGRLPNQGADL
jgi:hypothetical protein